MILKFLRSIFTLFLIVGAVTLVNAQSDATTRNGIPTKIDLPSGIKESLAKQRIDREKKDFAELLTRGEEAVKLSNELEKSFTQNNQLSAEDRKKIERLEKLVKKIRNELGGDGGDEKNNLDDKPLSVMTALNTLQNNTVKLVDELKKTTRYSISVIAVESSNLLLKVVRFLRIGKN
jgi:seryl-tRNA synthetase